MVGVGVVVAVAVVVGAGVVVAVAVVVGVVVGVGVVVVVGVVVAVVVGVAMSLDEDYLEQLRGAFDRYLVAVVRPLLVQNRDLKTALQAERRRTAGADPAQGFRAELRPLVPEYERAPNIILYGVPIVDYSREELLGALVLFNDMVTRTTYKCDPRA